MKIKALYLATASLLLASCSNSQGITGKWFGVQYGAPLIVEINDTAINVTSQASSQMSFMSNYQMEDIDGKTFNIGLSQVSGMQGLGVGELSGDSLKIGLVFGPEGYVTRPTSVNEASQQVAGMVLMLSRDEMQMRKALKQPANAPEQAKLAFERNRRLGHGINLNNVVDGNSFNGNPPDQPFTEKDAKRIADAGLNSVRLATTWVKHAEPRAPYTIDPLFFSKVDSIVDICLDNGLAVSIDMHYYPYINMQEPDSVLTFDENIDRLKAFWQQIADHYQGLPNDMVYFDLLNEPSMALQPDSYNSLIAELIGIVRKTNPDRTLIVGTPSLGQHWTIGLLELPQEDWNIIAQVHYYLPHTFTHQGLTYAPGAENTGVQWLGSDIEKAPIEADFDYMARWSQEQQRPIVVGEFGVSDSSDLESRARYLSFLRQMIDDHDMTFHLWGYRECFNIDDPETGDWDQAALDALDNEKK